MDRIRFGAAYYAEYQRRPDLAADFGLMAKAGFSVIRVGESVWSTWEPDDGRFDLDWLEPVLDAAHRHDIGVILGTPPARPRGLLPRHLRRQAAGPTVEMPATGASPPTRRTWRRFPPRSACRSLPAAVPRPRRSPGRT